VGALWWIAIGVLIAVCYIVIFAAMFARGRRIARERGDAAGDVADE
jgi:hypothetical protein